MPFPEGFGMADKKITNALYLPDWTVEDVKKPNAKTYLVEAAYDVKPDHCPKCGSLQKPYRHGPITVDYTDAPVHGRQTTVRVTVQRYRCRDCGKTFNQPLPDMDPARLMTKRLVSYVADQGLVTTYAKVSADTGLNEKTVRDVCNAHISRLLSEHRVTAPVALGIDELTLDGGERRSIFTDIGERRILDLIESMNRPAVDRWLYSLPHKDRVKIVTIDMHDPYRQAAYGILPNAVVIADRWHVQKLVNKRLDVIRNRIRRGKTGKGRKNPWRARRLIQASRHNLSPQRLFILDGMLKNDPLLHAAWQAKETFYDIWHGDPTRYEAEKRFDAWREGIPAEVQTEFGSLATVVEDWRQEVFAFFDHRHTNAYTEAANGLIKIANRAGRGYRFDAIRARAIHYSSLRPRAQFVCESCLGQYDVALSEWHRWKLLRVPHAPGAKRPEELCETCHRLHIKEWLHGRPVSTRKSG